MNRTQVSVLSFLSLVPMFQFRGQVSGIRVISKAVGH